MSIPLTRELGVFIARTRFADVPPDALPHVHTAFADCIGVMIAGAQEDAPQILKNVLAPAGCEATLFFGNERASALDAALINATAAHVLDYDDVVHRGHPSVILVPAILAEAESLGRSGEDMATAYAVGYETWAELARRDPDHQHKKGWHPTGIFGSIAAAAACASLNRLNAEQAAMAISLGASQSAGLIANFGTMAKPFHAGRAAQAGLLSARLARNGFTASLDALEHPPGFFAAVSVNNRHDLAAPAEAGCTWSLPRDRFSIKKYPVCFAAHPAIDATLDLVQAHDLHADAVGSMTVYINERHVNVLRNHAPQTGLEAKFSMEFAMASAVLQRRVGLGEITDDYVRRPEIQAFMKKVTLVPTQEDPARPGFGTHDRVTVQTTAGGALQSEKLTEARGGPQSPLTEVELWKKFDDCLTAGKARLPHRRLFERLMNLCNLANAGELYRSA